MLYTVTAFSPFPETLYANLLFPQVFYAGTPDTPDRHVLHINPQEEWLTQSPHMVKPHTTHTDAHTHTDVYSHPTNRSMCFPPPSSTASLPVTCCAPCQSSPRVANQHLYGCCVLLMLSCVYFGMQCD